MYNAVRGGAAPHERSKNGYAVRVIGAEGQYMKLASVALIVAVVALLMLAVAGPGTRLGLWEFGTGFTLMRWALFIGLGAAALSVILLIVPTTRRGHGVLLAAALVIGLGSAWVPWSGVRQARSVPPIHDITTDTVNPPSFVDVAPLRADAPNPLAYPGADTARQQHEAYPDIQTLELAQSMEQAFDRALETAREMGWEIVAAAPGEGRIEATATTFWFGFKDDVVVRVAAAGNGSRLDVRSKSRVGRSDIGKNAARIRSFVKAFRNNDDAAPTS